MPCWKPAPSASPPSAIPATSSTISVPKYSLKYYVKMAKQLEKLGAHFLGDQGYGGPVQAVRRFHSGESASRGDRHPDSLPHPRYQRNQRRFPAESLGSRCGCRRWRDGVDERRHQPAQSEFASWKLCGTLRATPNSTSMPSTSVPTIGKPCGLTIFRSTRDQRRDPPASMNTKFPVGSSRTCANRPPPWAWGTVGVKWKKRTRK